MTNSRRPPSSPTRCRVDRNTVLAGYRQLRDHGVLEFRGRGVHVSRAATAPIEAGRDHGLDRDDLIQLIRELT